MTKPAATKAAEAMPPVRAARAASAAGAVCGRAARDLIAAPALAVTAWVSWPDVVAREACRGEPGVQPRAEGGEEHGGQYGDAQRGAQLAEGALNAGPLACEFGSGTSARTTLVTWAVAKPTPMP